MRRCLLIFIFLIITFHILAQDPGYSQFFANPVYLNPAFAGTTELPRVAMNYRNQWPQKGATFTTYFLSYNQLLKNTIPGWVCKLPATRN